MKPSVRILSWPANPRCGAPMHLRAALLAASLATSFAMSLATSDATAADAPRGSVERGRTLYMELRCNSCHGTVGQGSGFSAAGPKILPDLFPWEAFLQQMRRPRLDMPAYIPKWVSDQDIADMYAYLVMLRDRPVPKSVPKALPSSSGNARSGG